MRPAYIALAFTLLGACAHLREAPLPQAEALAEGDALFARRAEGEATLREAIEAYRSALAVAPQDPVVLARLAGAYNALAFGYTRAVGDYATARELAMGCLRLGTGFESRLAVSGQRVDDGAVRRIEPASRACLDELLVAWLRWVELAGPAATLDLDELALLARRARALGANDPTWVAPWASAMVELLRPGRSPRDWDRADQWLTEAARAEPELAVPGLDRARHLLLPRDDLDRAEELLTTLAERHPPAGPWALENQAAAREAEGIWRDMEALRAAVWSRAR